MTTPQLRMLELALEEVLGGARPPELADRIVDAAMAPRRRPIRALFGVRGVLSAAAVLAAVMLGVLAWPEGESKPETVDTPPLTEAQRAKLDELAPLIRVGSADLDLNSPRDLDRLKTVEMAGQQLRALVAEWPGAWDYVRDRLGEIPTEANRTDVRDRMVTLLAFDPPSRPRVVAELKRDAAGFPIEPLLHLADEADTSALEEVARRAVAATPTLAVVRPAILIGMRGDRRAEPSLRWFLANGNFDLSPELLLGCSAALARLGDSSMWPDAVKVVGMNVTRALDSGDLKQARNWVRRIEYFSRGRTEPVPLAFLSEQLYRFAATGRENLQTEVQIRDRLADLAK
ncbi:MAG: hypothetical protein ACYTGZ_11105 [Planctomycetota bacterium]|jgi:hypothetical protein